MIRKLIFTAAVFILIAISVTRNIKEEMNLPGNEKGSSLLNPSLFSIAQAASSGAAESDGLKDGRTTQQDERQSSTISPSQELETPAGMLIAGGEITVNGKPVETGATILIDNTVSTGPHSFAVISFGSLGQVELPPDTTFRLAKKQGKLIGIENSIKESAILSLAGLSRPQGTIKEAFNEPISSGSLMDDKGGFSGLVKNATIATLNVTASNSYNQNTTSNHNSGGGNSNQNCNANPCRNSSHIHSHCDRHCNINSHNHNCSPTVPCSCGNTNNPQPWWCILLGHHYHSYGNYQEHHNSRHNPTARCN